MKKQATLFGLICWMILFSFDLFAQTKEQRETLLKLSESFDQRFTSQKIEAVHLANSLKIPVRIESDEGQVIELMRFENGIPVYYVTHNAGGASLINTDKVYPGGIAGLNLTGAGQTLGIWDGGKVRNTHQELNGRVTQIDGASTLSSHSTHVAGTMIGAGTIGIAKGMSYQATLNAWDWDNDYAEIATAAANGLKVSQHSYGYLTGWYYNTSDSKWYWYGNTSISQTEDYYFGFYDNYARDIDQIAYNAPYYLHVKSASNDRGEGPAPGTSHSVWGNNNWVTSTAIRDIDGGSNGYDCISRNALAKNILTVGAVSGTGDMAYFSGWGPTDDGRIKPDIVAKGVSVYSSISTNDNSYGTYSGTSMSGPMVSGSIGLLHQHQQNLHPGAPLRASTIKALIIHSADDNISGAPGPDYRFGWGLMNTQKAVEIMSANALADGIHVQELTLTNGGAITIQVKANGGEPLRATIVWTDLPGTPVAAALNPTNLMLVNDLDLRLSDPSATTLYPYVLNPSNPSAPATTGDNFRDNVEQVHIATPVAQGLYEIRISHKGTLAGGNQPFSLIISGNQNISSVSNPITLTATATGLDKINLQWGKNLDLNNVMLVWSDLNSFGTPANGTAYLPGQTIPGGGTVLYRGNLTSFEHTSLSAATTYYYKAFSYNPDNIYSTGRSAVATTNCFIITSLPFSENFATSVTPPTCWEIADNQGNGQVWKFGTIAGYTPNPALTPNYAYLNSDAYGSGNSQNTDLITPVIDLRNYKDVSLSFSHYYRHYLASVATLYYSINNGASWVQLQQWISTTSNPAAFSQLIPELSGKSAVNFKWNFSGTWGFYWAIDNVLLTGTLVDKPIVQTISVSAASTTSGSANGNVITAGTSPVSARGFCWSTSADPTFANNHISAGSGTGSFSANLAGLQAGTTYYVRAYATNLSGTTYGENKTFVTFCPDSYSIPYSENFTNPTNIPNCWFRQNTEATPNFIWMVGSVTNGVTGTTAPYAYATYTGGAASSAMLVSPAFDFTGYSGVTIKFRHCYYRSNTGAGTAAFEYSIDGGINWVVQNEYTNNTEANYSNNIAALSGQSKVRFRWRLTSASTAANRTRTYSFDSLVITATPTNLYADFTANKTNAYLNEPIVFTDASGSLATSWSWNFGSGAIPATANTKGPHNVSYNTPGLKTVMLTVNGTVVKTKTNFISITENAIMPPRQLAGSVNNYTDVSLSWLSPRLNDGFEHYNNFNLNFGNYIQRDLDNSPTYGLSSVIFSNMYYTGSFVIFNPSEVSPPLTTGWEPFEGKKYAACFAATTPPNNDWLITPPVKVSAGESFGFFAKSYTATYGLERFKVGVSVSGTQPENFTIISTGNYLEAPTSWTKFSFDLSAYTDQVVHLAIICISNNAFVFMVDKLMIEGGPESDQTITANIIPEPQAPFIELEKTTGTAGPVMEPYGLMLPASFGSYNVYRNGNLIASTSDFTYSDPDLPPGIYDYSITANYINPALESGPSNIQQLIINTSIWRGTLGSDWFTDGNWSGNKTPTANDHAIIPYSGVVNFPVVANDLAKCMDLTIKENATLVASVSGSLTSSGILTNETGYSGLILESNASGTGSLIHNTSNVPATIRRYIPAAGYHLVSVPVTQQSNPTSLLFLWSYLFEFEITGQKWVGLGAPTGTPLSVDKGYMIYKYPGPAKWEPDTTYTFKGNMNNGIFTCDVVYPNFSGNHNLVPNPYPSAVNWDATSGWSKVNLSDAIWIWNPAGSGNYAAYVAGVGTNGGTNIIPAGQAFFVQANSGSPALLMDNAARVHSPQAFFKNEEQIKDVLRVKAIANNSSDEIVIRFSEFASNNFDSQLDASKMYGFAKTPQLYSTSADNEKLSINTMPYTGGAFGVPLGFQIDSVINVIFEFSSIESFDPEIPIFLWDTRTGIMVNLRTTSSYSFWHNPGGDPMRFVMMFNSAAAVEEVYHPEITTFIQNDFLHLTIPESLGYTNIVNIYDASGRLVLTKNSVSGSSSFNVSGFSRGLYVVQVVGSKYVLTQKVVF